MKEEYKYVSVRFPVKILKLAKEQARKERGSFNSHVIHALEELLRRDPLFMYEIVGR